MPLWCPNQAPRRRPARWWSASRRRRRRRGASAKRRALTDGRWGLRRRRWRGLARRDGRRGRGWPLRIGGRVGAEGGGGTVAGEKRSGCGCGCGCVHQRGQDAEVLCGSGARRWQRRICRFCRYTSHWPQHASSQRRVQLHCVARCAFVEIAPIHLPYSRL